MPERLAIVIVVAIALTSGVIAIRWWSARRLGALRLADPLWDALGLSPDGRRTLIAFSSPSCGVCHRAQAPAIKVVEQQLGEDSVRVVRIDAAHQPDVARAFGVLTVPSTVVLEAAGRVIAVNHGFAPSRRLIEQIQGTFSPAGTSLG
jgi:hypothetical protein